MKLLVIADEDSFTKALTAEPADLLISCGDLADVALLKTINTVHCQRAFAVKGNHDSAAPFPDPIIDLHLRTENYDGLTFGRFNGSWKYKPRGHFLYEQEVVVRLLAGFPPVDIFVAHNSPRNVHERDSDVHVGFDAFVDYIHRTQPRLFFHGHQHINQETQIGRTQVIGVFEQRRFEI